MKDNKPNAECVGDTTWSSFKLYLNIGKNMMWFIFVVAFNF